MRKTITAALAALTIGGALAAAAAPASAEGWHGGGWGHGWHGGGGWRGDDAGLAIVAGVTGLALGAALADDHPRYYGGYYPAPGYYYGGPYGTCYGRREVWDPYLGRYIVQRYAYGC